QYNVVFCSGTAILPAVRLVGNTRYPAIADDFAASFHLLKSLPCDVFLAPHGSHFGLKEKLRRRGSGERSNPFIDPEGYKSFVARSEASFMRQLDLERRGRVPRAGAPLSNAMRPRNGS